MRRPPCELCGYRASFLYRCAALRWRVCLGCVAQLRSEGRKLVAVA